ncbi:MAG: acyl carrier protein [Clostridiales bacterium]|nr:acyl carrier protein [Clostridiales bacterium]
MFDTVKKILIDDLQIDEKEITPEAELINDLGINSLELADLVMNCEDNFHIEIKDEEIRDFVTVGDVAEYLEKVTAAAPDRKKNGK